LPQHLRLHNHIEIAMRALDLETSQSEALEAKLTAAPQPRYDPRTRALIEGPIAPMPMRWRCTR
jgi:hypothetical protein